MCSANPMAPIPSFHGSLRSFAIGFVEMGKSNATVHTIGSASVPDHFLLDYFIKKNTCIPDAVLHVH